MVFQTAEEEVKAEADFWSRHWVLPPIPPEHL